MQRLADLLDAPVDRPMMQETTALGAAYLAGLAAGVYPEPEKFADHWRLERRFKPAMRAATRERKLAGWARAVKGVLASDEGEGCIREHSPTHRRLLHCYMTDILPDTLRRLYTDPGEYIDSDHPAVQAFAGAAARGGCHRPRQGQPALQGGARRHPL